MVKLQRYRQLTAELEQLQCRHLIEVGTWNGRRAQELLRAVLKENHDVTYHGFDLFEDLTDAELEAELSKRPPGRAEVEASLRSFERKIARRGRILSSRGRRVRFTLHQGYTQDTLPAFRKANPALTAEFIFIDGGHKIETIASDWAECSQLVATDGAVYLDDFYGDQELARSFGCNWLVGELGRDADWDVTVLPVADTIPDLGTIQIVRVRRSQ